MSSNVLKEGNQIKIIIEGLIVNYFEWTSNRYVMGRLEMTSYVMLETSYVSSHRTYVSIQSRRF
jgi:hypothetical protein